RHSCLAGAVRPGGADQLCPPPGPCLEEQDFAEAGQRLDQLPDRAFTGLGLSREDVAELRDRFASWPRQAQARREDRATRASDSADWQVQGVSRTEPAASRGTRQAR